MLTLDVALNGCALHANNIVITADGVKQLLANVRGVTFASVTQVTTQALAAANKHITVQKVSVVPVLLFNNIKDFNIYSNAVKRSAGVDDFVQSESSFDHDAQCYSVVRNKNDNTKEYLYYVANNNARTHSMYISNGVEMTREDVAALCTPSVAKTILNPSTTVRNVSNNIEHSVHVRTVKLENIVSITAQRQTMTV